MSAREWVMYANEYSAGFMHFGERYYVELYDSSSPIVHVKLIEDEQGKYLGWLAIGKETVEMVQRSILFDMQFTYGHVVEEAAGKGKVIKLRVEKING